MLSSGTEHKISSQRSGPRIDLYVSPGLVVSQILTSLLPHHGNVDPDRRRGEKRLW
jgi:hypothetical protein